MSMLGYEKRVSKDDITFGIEDEFTGLKRLESAKILADYFNCNYIHTSKHGLDCYRLSNGWEIVSDSSVSHRPEDNELVTPILKTSDIDILKGALKALSDRGAFTDLSCGLHVHVSNPHMVELAVVKKLLQHDFTRYDMIYLSCRGYKGWCKPQNEAFVRKISKMDSRSKVREEWYEEYAHGYTGGNYNESRYHGCNLHSLYQGKGVEYRYFSGSFDWEKINAYIELSQGMLMDSINSYKMKQYLYVDRPYNKVYSRDNRNENLSIADCVIIPDRVLYKYSRLWKEYLDRMEISKESQKVLLANF